MSTTALQDRQFGARMIDTLDFSMLLEPAIEWIENNLEPQDVFGDKALETWAEDNGYVIRED